MDQQREFGKIPNSFCVIGLTRNTPYIITMFEEFRVEARKNMTGTGGQLREPIQYLADYPISLPPIDLQNQFEDFVRQTDKSKYIWHNALNTNCVGGECYA